ncbi:dihydrodipicolinate synthase family protein [Bowmanella yangjiangensis]|uniref:Dihydrodipicolinate synthase family protein n=1 Tax=Bowmanella yangjiangensis TaxID=2811230 RepID=A0ABS3CR33_9ALTE|nr:dihydrodipicolinate synthase family protein [Bowmanella yangjiangensis]MBN7819577.1 dihydrodipicolinate synthase family protein [Bowmanella yangjiangensis]
MQLSGIIAYPVTPFHSGNGEINLAALTQSLEHLIEQDCDAIAPLGSTGESAYLSLAEWMNVAECSVKTVNKRLPVIIGISELTTSAAIVKAKYAERIGADAIMVIPVSYWKLTDSEIQAYYQAIADSTSLPIMVYNNPGTSGVDMSPELIVKMAAEIDNVCMVKESSGDIQRMHKIFSLSQGKLPFYNGCNPLALEALCAGASGWCTAAPNLLGKHPKALYQAVRCGELEKARQHFYQQLPLLHYIVAGGLPKTIKAGLSLLGIDAGIPRQPLQEASAEDKAKLGEYMAAVQ